MRAYLFLGRFRRGSRRETAQDEERMRASRQALRITLQGCEDVDDGSRIPLGKATTVIGRAKHLQDAEISRRRHDADNRPRTIVQPKSAPDDAEDRAGTAAATTPR